MTENNDNISQLGLGGDFNEAKGTNALRVFQPKLAVPYPVPTRKESFDQLSLIDAKIKEQISGLRVVQESKKVKVETNDRNRTEVFLEETMILRKVTMVYGRKKINHYFTVNPVAVESVAHKTIWTLPIGREVETFRQDRKVSKKMIPEVIRKLQPYTKVS